MWGYTERYCDYANDDEDERSIWSHDFVIDIPTGNIATGCAALCNEGEYDGPKRAISLETAVASCTSMATWSDFAGATAAQATIVFPNGDNPSTAWQHVLDYTSGGVATAADTRAPQQSGAQQTTAPTSEMPPLQTLTEVVTSVFTTIAPAPTSAGATALLAPPVSSVVTSVYTTAITVPAAPPTGRSAGARSVSATWTRGMAVVGLVFLAVGISWLL